MKETNNGFKIAEVKDGSNKDLSYTINKTMMRIDLKSPLNPKQKFTFKIKYSYNINDRMEIGGRSGYEYFKEDDNYLYTIAQFYPRMAVYSDIEGWQNKQFLGNGEFATEFGDFQVNITVPSDHVVAATGMLQNASSVLTAAQRKRFKEAYSATSPIEIVTVEEALAAEKEKAKSTKTWSFKADNVRDFAFASSRKFIWDAMGVQFGNRTVLAMSFYPNEGNPLWGKYSTEVVAQTLKTYSKHTFDYPYPVAISVHAADIGMEYPMICFNYGRPEKDGTYSERIKYGMMSVIIHEVGHNYFPMIVNSDERQWTWMDEGLNTFLQFLTEKEWDKDYPSRRGPAYKITDYMGGDKAYIMPIMTNSESLLQFGNNAYGKPAAALNILRETVMGRELFDYAFKTYAQRWMFKHPSPEDFFRTMEDASGVDLDWFWRGWFYTNDHVDISLDNVKWFQLDSKNPTTEKAFQKDQEAKAPVHITKQRNQDLPPARIEQKEELKDFYNTYDKFEVTVLDQKEYDQYVAGLDDDEKELLEANYNYYQLEFSNIGGLVMPLVLRFEYTDGSEEIIRIPAEIWVKNNYRVTKVFPRKKELVSIKLDPFLETADCDMSNNYWPPVAQPTKFELYKRRQRDMENEMQRAKRAEEASNE